MKWLDELTENTRTYKDLFTTDRVHQVQLKSQCMKIFMASLFLWNLDQEIYGDILVDYRKYFANKGNKYPTKTPDMIDGMHKIPEKRGELPKTTTQPTPKEEKEETATNFAQQSQKGVSKKMIR